MLDEPVPVVELAPLDAVVVAPPVDDPDDLEDFFMIDMDERVFSGQQPPLLLVVVVVLRFLEMLAMLSSNSLHTPIPAVST